jgi:hypothetical protein
MHEWGKREREMAFTKEKKRLEKTRSMQAAEKLKKKLRGGGEFLSAETMYSLGGIQNDQEDANIPTCKVVVS